MSKKVTIPTDGGNPFVVILGGIKYVYKPGETVDVPDGVALEIKEWERWKDKYHGAVQPPFAAGGGGVQPDLSQTDPNAADYVKNRTHYEETTVVNEPLNITWDGNTDGLVSVQNFMYKVSDLVLTNEQIKSASIVFAGKETPMTDDSWAEMIASGNVTEEIVNLSFVVMFVRKAGAVVQGVALPETGIYFSKDQGRYVSSLTTTEPVEQTKTVVKKLDKKFLPDDIGSGSIMYCGGNNDDDDVHLFHFNFDTGEIGDAVTREDLVAAVKHGAIYVALIDEYSVLYKLATVVHFSDDDGYIGTSDEEYFHTAEFEQSSGPV